MVQANRAACLLKLGKHREALEACDNSLKVLLLPIFLPTSLCPSLNASMHPTSHPPSISHIARTPLVFSHAPHHHPSLTPPLQHNGANLKATYRKALALEGLGRHAEALEAARTVVKADPKDKASTDLARRLARHETEAALDVSSRRDPLQVG